MKELIIHEFEAKQIEDTLRIISNILKCQTKATCADRQVVKSQEMIKRVLSKQPYK